MILFFGRAGLASAHPGDRHSRTAGTDSLERSSVTPSTADGYNFYVQASGAFVSHSNSRAYGIPLRCLVNSTVGEKE